MKKFIVWNDTHDVLLTDIKFGNVEDAEKYIEKIKNDIRLIAKIYEDKKIMNADKVQFSIHDFVSGKEYYGKRVKL